MTRSSPPGVLVLAWLTFASPPASQAQATSEQPAATVRVSAQRDTTLTAADLARLPRSRIQTAVHGDDTSHAQVLYEGVAVADLLALVGAPLGPALRGRAVASYLLIEAADGYRVVFSLEEADARTPTPRLLLADRRNGRPLSPDEGPFRVIAPDARHSRWIRQVVRIAVRAAAP
jgi:DMSO/TMAO reductase YedYZ molybdopterin-dependent catalytic subunit